MIYSEKVRDLREYEGIKQVDIAKYLELDPIVYGHFEREETLIPLKYLIKICDYFNVRLDYVFNFTEEKGLLKTNYKINFGLRIKEIRKELDLTQAKLAKVLNTTQSVIADYERGRYLISLSFLYDMCKKYNISADYLLGRIDFPKYLGK